MKILVLTSTYPRWPDDTEPAFVHELARRLQAEGITVEVLTPHAPGSRTQDLLDGVHVVRYRYCFERWEILAGPGGILSRIRKRPLALGLVPIMCVALALALHRRLRAGQYALVHAHWLIPQGLVAVLIAQLMGRRIPVLCTSHGGDLFALRSPLFRSVRRWVVRQAAHVTVVSRYMQQVLLADGAPAASISVAPMGVDLRGFAPVAGIARDPWGIIFVGRLVEKKGARHLLDAFATLHAELPDVKLTIVGDGPERDALVAQVERLRLGAAVDFQGALPQRELPSRYSAAAIAVVPSVVDRSGDQEGLGLVTIEALGCGCAVVASDLPAIRDVITPGENGLLARPADAGDLAARIRELLLAPDFRARLAARGRIALGEKFAWDVVAGGYAGIMKRLAGGNGGAMP